MNLSFSFKRQQRLLKPSDFQCVFDQPTVSSDHYLTVLAKPNHLLNARLGLTIAKKRVRGAVDRNRIKRLTRESFRQYQHQLIGLDCIVLARNETGDVSNSVLQRSLARHWQQIARKCKNS